METKSPTNTKDYQSIKKAQMTFENGRSGEDGMEYDIVLKVFDFLQKREFAVDGEGK